MVNPKILYFDIETSHCLAYVWGCGKQYVAASQIVKERKVLTIAWLWGYEYDAGKKPHVLTMNMDKHKLYKFDDDADKEMIKKFMKVYEKADLAVAHNGRSFDLARLRARLFRYGLPDIHPTLFDDSYTFTKDIDLTSHKLDYIAKLLGTKRKTETTLSMWFNVMAGSKKALKLMAEYNKDDVMALVPIYRHSLKYAKSKLNKAVLDFDAKICPQPECKGNLILRNGHIITRIGRKRKLQCQTCGKYFTTGINLLKDARQYPR